MEAMAAESLVASDWELDGYLTKVRWTVPVVRGYSDIDVVGVNGGGCVRVAECKVRGPAQLIYVINANSGAFGEWLGSWKKFISNVPRLWEAGNRPAWVPEIRDVSGLEVW